MAVNLRSQMLTCKHAIPEMVRHGGGSIINMSSGASLKGDRTRTAYGVSKAGVNTLTMYVAAGHGKQGIRVNTIVPGLIITDAVRAHLTEDMLAGLGRATLTPYLGEPDDIADLVVFLASDESRYITGQMIAIDGGMSAHVGTRRTGRVSRPGPGPGRRLGSGRARARRRRCRDGGTSRSRPGSRRRRGWSVRSRSWTGRRPGTRPPRPSRRRGRRGPWAR